MADNTNTSSSTLDNAALMAEIERLRGENAALKSTPKAVARLTLKVSQKGAISIYGLGRWPVTLYRSQAERLFSDETVKAVREFITANVDKLAVREG